MAVVRFDNMSASKLSGSTFMPPNESTTLDLMRLSPVATTASETDASVEIMKMQATSTVSQTITCKEMRMQTSVHAAQYLDAQASSLQVDTAQQRELGEIESCSDSWSLGSITSLGSLSLCLSDVIEEALSTQAKLLREANDSELNHDNKELVAEIDKAATARADFLFEETVSVVLNQTNISTISSLSSPHYGTTCETAKLTLVRSVRRVKWQLSSSRKVAARKTPGGMRNRRSSLLKKRSSEAPNSTINRPEVSMRSTDILELSEDRYRSYKVKTDGKLARCVETPESEQYK